MKRSIVILFCIALIGCRAPFRDDESEARMQLLEIAPIGSDARDALPILESRGFKCKWSKQEEFYGLTGKNDYLYCDIEKLAGILVTRRWQLALIHENYIVTDAKFGIGLTGL